MVDISRAYQEVKTLPDEALAQELSNPSGMVPGYLVMAEMEDRKAIRSGGGGGMGKRPSMKDELLGGVGSVQQYAIGGLVKKEEDNAIFSGQGLDGKDPKYVWSNSMALSAPGWVLPSVAPGLNMYGRNFAGMLAPVSSDQSVMPGSAPPVPQQAAPQKKKFAGGGIVGLTNPGYGGIVRAQNPDLAYMQMVQGGQRQAAGLAGLADLSSMVPTAPGTPGVPKQPPSIEEMRRMG